MIALKKGTKVRVACKGRADLHGKVATIVAKAKADEGGVIKFGLAGFAYEVALSGGARIWIDEGGLEALS